MMIRLRSLGDCVLTTPALDILKRARPDLRVAVVVEGRFRAIFESNPDVDEILAPEIAAVRGWRPALCVNLHGGARSARLTALSGASVRAGFGHFRFQWLYNVRIPRAQEILGVERTVHTAEHLASAMFWLGAGRVDIPRAKLVASENWTGHDTAGIVAPRQYAVIHAVAATPEKTWHADGFLAVADYLKRSGLDPVFIGAASDDLGPFRYFRTMHGASLEDIKKLLSGASLFVGNDSGPAQIGRASCRERV
jgi:heptosyltransferase-3